MLLRSSSTPIAQSLFSDSPTRDFIDNTTHNHQKSQDLEHFSTNFSFIHNLHHHRLLHVRSFSCNSSPISHSTSGYSESNPHLSNLRCKPFRRAQSDSNLEDLASISLHIDEFCSSKILAGSLGKQNKSMMQSEPSFCIYNSEDGFQENAKGNLGIGKGNGSGEFSFGKKSMGLIEGKDEEEREERLSELKNLGSEEEVEPVSPPMYLATGFGIDANGISGNGFDLKPTTFDESGDVEEYYKRMVIEDPSNSLFLRNYARLLQSKGDLTGSEEYYFRATLVDPTDGEILMQYAKLVWELHHDQDRALNYFESAALASPEDSNVLAAYASFLWEIGEDRDNAEDTARSAHIQNSTFEAEERPVSPSLHLAAGLGVDVASFGNSGGSVNYAAEGFGTDGNIEEYYKRTVEDNPCNPLYLRNYAQFLCQSKGDLQGAEEYYSRAMLADPGDGEVTSQYAQLVWELHHDQDKASCYFERSVQAAPRDSHVLAAYTRFLWETEDEEHSGHQDDIQLPVLQGAMTSANA